MGLTWTAEMISWALEAKVEGYNLFKIKEFVYCDLVFQIINSSQGIILFLVVFFDSGRIKELKKKMTKKPVETTADPSSTISPSTNVTNMRYIFPFFASIEFLILHVQLQIPINSIRKILRITGNGQMKKNVHEK